MRNAKTKKYSLVRSELERAGEGLERRGELGWPGLAGWLVGDLKVITAGMSQVRPHFDE